MQQPITPPDELLKIKDDLSKSLKVKIKIVRGRKNLLQWVLTTLDKKTVLHKGRFILGRGGKQFLNALDSLLTKGTYYLFFYEEENIPNLKCLVINDKKVLFLKHSGILNWIDQINLNPHLPYVKSDFKKVLAKDLIQITPEKLEEIIEKEKVKAEVKESIFARFFSSAKRIIKTKIMRTREREVEAEIAERLVTKSLKTKEDVLRLLKDRKLLKNLEIYDLLLSRFKEGITEEEFNHIKKNLPQILLVHTILEENLKKLDEFEKKVHQDGVPEPQLQEFLVDHSWIFGEEYYGCIRAQENIGISSRNVPDFILEDILKRGDGFSFVQGIVELKRADAEIIKRDTRKIGKFAPTSAVLDAIWQGIRYIRERLKTGRYSKVFIVIGRTKNGKKEVEEIQVL